MTVSTGSTTGDRGSTTGDRGSTTGDRGSTTGRSTVSPAVHHALAHGDDALVLAQRLGAWISRAPELEEDVALGNIALDLLGQARALLSHAGELEGAGRDEDDLAFLRDEREFLNLQLVEQPNEDFAVTIARQLAFSAYQLPLHQALRSSTDETIAAVAAKAVKEVGYHLDHAVQWTLRLGDGTDESHRRMQAGLERIWPYVEELFTPDPVVADLVDEGVAVDVATLREPWLAVVRPVLERATLAVPETWTAPGGGRRGVHTESFGFLLAEMQHLHRSHPGATW